MPMKKTDFFYTRVIQTIEEEGLIDPGDKILIGVSGGADSMALLHCLILFSRDNPIHPGVAHLNHMLRGKESDRDADFTEKITNKAGLPFYGKKTDVAKYQSEHGLSTEDAARKVRYAFFRQIAEKNGYNKIATAHHADDNAELILMNLVRGTGLSGLTGIPAKRLLDENAAHGIEIIRPLINHLKTEITQWLESEKIGFITDSSNFDDSFFRNRIRKSVMPFLYERSGQKTSEIINRTGKILKGENQWLADISEELFQKAIAEKSDSKVSLNIAIFNTFPLVAKRRVLRLAVASVKKDLRRISFFHSELIIEMLEKNADKNFRLDLHSRIIVLK
jgi:tRNA(Ile)-lysidine synthase